jgi:hypothetical protein
MNRDGWIRIVLAVWITGSVLPLALSMLFTFGCCVLPFHQLLHRYVPACHITRILLEPSRDQGRKQLLPRSSNADAVAATPAPQAAIAALFERRSRPSPPRRARDLMSLGAIRCESDVGSQKLLSVWLI